MFGEPAAQRPGLPAALATALSLVTAGVASAATAPVSLTWSAPPDCPQAEAVRGWLMGHLGDAADPAGYPGVRTRGEVTRAGAGWQLRLVIERDGAPGERSLSGRDCEELSRSGALALAIALEPTVGAADVPATVGAADEPASGAAALIPAPPPSLVPLPPTPPVDAPPPVAPQQAAEAPPPASEAPAVVPPTPAPRRLAHALRVAGGLEAGLLPGVGGGVTAGYALRLRWLRLELVGSYWAVRRRDYEGMPGVGARATLGTAGLRICPNLRLRESRDSRPAAPGLVELALCAGLEVGALAVRGVGYPDARALVRPWLAVEVQPAIAWRFARRVALWGGIALVVPTRRGAFRIDPLPELFRVGAVGLRAALGVELQLGRDPAQKK